MTYSVEFSEADGALIREYSAARNISEETFITEAARRAARNAAYLAKIDRGIKQMEEGTGTLLTWDDFEAIRDGRLTLKDLEAMRDEQNNRRRRAK